MTGQMSIFDWMPELRDQPPWVQCFASCKHFDSHPEYPPDRFPGNRTIPRCTYCNSKDGTSGKQFYFKDAGTGTACNMYCKLFEWKDVD